ncbi:MAG TPA: hypothetical protein PLR60_04470 [Syntrophorhabdaceae bacterium]|nr:hypothetical protein [Syntrophorhabdaceae bacterium]
MFEETKHGITTTAKVLLDGHHRHAIAINHGLPFDTREIEFEDEDAALVWAVDTQLGRRNIIHPLDRVSLLEKKRPALERQAEARQLAGKAEGDLTPLSEQGPKKRRAPTVLEQLAREAGMGRTTYDACLLILGKGIPALVEFVRQGDLSITGAGKLLSHTPGRGIMNDEEHRAWQQRLVDKVQGHPDAMQAVIRNINWRARDSKRECDAWEREAERQRKEEEDFQAREKQDEEDIKKWREELEAETPAEEEQTGTVTEEETKTAEEEAAPEQEEETETETKQTGTVTEIPRPPRPGENIREIVAAIIDAARDILAARGLGISEDGELALGDAVEVWVIEYARDYYYKEQVS